MKKNTAILLLLLVTVIWGGGFIAIKMCLNYGMTSGTLNMCRGAIFSATVFTVFHRQILSMSKETFKVGLFAGIFNSLSFIFRGIGAGLTKPSSTSFLSSISVVLVPFMVWAAYKVKPKAKNLVAVVVCLIGMAILTDMINQGFTMNTGDILVIISSVFFGTSIIILSRQPKDCHFSQSAFLLAITLFAGGLFYTLFGHASFAGIRWNKAIMPLVYLAFLSNFVAQCLQIETRRYLPASTASLIMTLEGVFGSIFSVLLGFESFTMSLFWGGTIIFISLVICEGELPKRAKQ